MQLMLAPLHGITNHLFRNCLNRHVGSLDAAVTPFLAAVEDAQLNVRKWTDIRPENNVGLEVIPQLMGNRPEAMVDTVRALQGMGYRRINWNIGCPSAQVVRKQRGCGIMPHPDRVEAVARAVSAQTDCAFSVKMRLGWQSPAEGMEIVERLNAYPLDFIAIHPRLGVQEYTGTPDLPALRQLLDRCRHRVVYSGDVVDLPSYEAIATAFPNLHAVMLGRGILKNIFLAEEIHAGHTIPQDIKRQRFANFYHDLSDTVATARGKHGALSTLKELWHYFATFVGMSDDELRELLRITDFSNFEQNAGKYLDN